MKKALLFIIIIFGALAAQAGAQVIGVQPIPLAFYCWNASTSQWEMATNSSTAEASPFTPQPTALYGFNASLGQWTPFIASAGNCATGGGGSGTVTSVGLSLPGIFSVIGPPVTTAGTLTATLASQSPNTFWAAPNGISGTPLFRLLTAPDIAQAGTLSNNISGNAATATGVATNLSSASAAYYPMLAPLADTSLGQTAQVASNLSFDPFTSTLTVGLAPTGNTVTLKNLSTIPASWVFDLTSPATACASIGCNPGTVTNPLTAASSGSGAGPGSTYNGSTAVTFSYNSFGAAGISGTPVAGNCVDWVTPSTIGDAGAACGTGSGGGIGSIGWSLPAFMTATPSSISASGTQTFSFNTESNHRFLGNNSGSTAAPVFTQPAFSDLSGNLGAAQGPTSLTGLLYDTAGTLSAANASQVLGVIGLGGVTPAYGGFGQNWGASTGIPQLAGGVASLYNNTCIGASAALGYSSGALACNSSINATTSVISGTNVIGAQYVVLAPSTGNLGLEVANTNLLTYNPGTGTLLVPAISVSSLIAAGTQSLSVSGTGCALSAEAGGAMAGNFTLANPDSSACVLTITLPTAPNGWMCSVPNGGVTQTASTATTAAVTFNEAAVGEMWYSCKGF